MLRRTLIILVTALLSTACAGMAVPAAAAEEPNVLVVAADSKGETLVRVQAVYERVTNAIVGQLMEEGFAAFDETAAVAGRFSVDLDSPMSDQLVLDLVRAIETPPIDVAVIYKLYPRERKLPHSRKIGARIEGRLLNVRSGRRLGSFEVASPNLIPVALDCDRSCLIETLGDEARILAQHAGAVLAVKLQDATVVSVPSTAAAATVATASASAASASAAATARTGLPQQYVLVFNNFTDEDILDVEHYLTAFGGYAHHRPVRCQPRHCKYWYETTSDVARLRRNLQIMLDSLSIRGTVMLAGAGNGITVEKTGVIE